MSQVRSITEAFSPLLKTLTVGEICDGIVINSIKKEDIKINGDPYEHYVGYSPQGDKIFQYRSETVNVTFFV